MKATHFHCRELEKFRKSVRKISLITPTQRHLPLTFSYTSLHFFCPVTMYVCDMNELLLYVTVFACLFYNVFSQGIITILKELNYLVGKTDMRPNN